jgi:hypothetical protein
MRPPAHEVGVASGQGQPVRIAIFSVSRDAPRRLGVRARYFVRKRRAASLLLCGALAVVLGIASVLFLGQNRPGAGQAYDGFGHVYWVALPKGVTRIEDISTFEILPGGADDFTRAELNGHVVVNSEDRWGALIPERTDDRTRDETLWDLTKRHVVDRSTYLMHRKAIQFALVQGLNHLVVELENYRGPCGGGIQVFVNGQPIIGAPMSLPLRGELRDDDERLLPRAHREHALCARVAYQFKLD